MNILFVTTFQVAAQKGGTERTTTLVSDELRRRGNKCYNLYDKSIDKRFEMTVFDKVFNDTSIKSVTEIINDYNIEHIIIEGAITLVDRISTARLVSKRKPKIYFVHHFMPGCEPLFNTFYNLRKRFLHSESTKSRIVSAIKIVLYPLYKPYTDNMYHRLYKSVYESCDKVVLLASDYKDGFCAFGGFFDQSKFCNIPNAQSFPDTLPVEELTNKTKTILVVSRLDETQKRISLVIKMWRKIEDDPLLKDWQLKIVGFGESETDYKSLARQLSLERITFEGRQHPVPYYKESSIFLMTSLYEGWGMTLMEASQFGCIPMVYDTCAAFKEIIENGNNGYLIKEGDENAFVRSMRELMLNDQKREAMMRNAITSSARFTMDKVIAKWEDLLQEK